MVKKFWLKYSITRPPTRVFCPPSSQAQTAKKPPQPFKSSLCEWSFKINSFCYQTFISKNTPIIAISYWYHQYNSYYHHIRNNTKYSNHPIHRCDDRLDPQFEFQQASGERGWNGRVNVGVTSWNQLNISYLSRFNEAGLYDKLAAIHRLNTRRSLYMFSSPAYGQEFYGSSTLRNADR